MPPVDLAAPRLAPPRQVGKRLREEPPVPQIALPAIAAAAAFAPNRNGPLLNDGWNKGDVQPLTQAEVQGILVKTPFGRRDYAIRFRTKEKAKAFVEYMKLNQALLDIATYRENYVEKSRCYSIYLELRPEAKQQGYTMQDVLFELESFELLSPCAKSFKLETGYGLS